jgi:periplasmic protein TonB
MKNLFLAISVFIFLFCGASYGLEKFAEAGPDPKMEYLRSVQKKIVKLQRYPDSARREGIVGKVKVQFTILKTGELEKLKIIKSPHDILSKAATKAIQQAAPFPKFPKDINKESLVVILPFRFELSDDSYKAEKLK